MCVYVCVCVSVCLESAWLLCLFVCVCVCVRAFCLGVRFSLLKHNCTCTCMCFLLCLLTARI